MTTYNTYQEAKIANPECEIFHVNGICFFNYEALASDICNPADYCMTVEKFLADGHEVFMGDAIINANGNVNYITQGDAKMINSEGGATFNKSRYILRAAALEKIPTETPEEKEALDGIESAGEVEWKSGDIAMLYGDQVLVIAYHPNHPVVVVETNDNEYLNVWINDLSKPETPHHREERERLEAAEDLYYAYMSHWDFNPDWEVLDETNRNAFLTIVDKTNYRKEKTHGTN